MGSIIFGNDNNFSAVKLSWNPSHFWGYVPASLLVVPNALLVLLDLLLIQESLVGGQICHFFSYQAVHNLAVPSSIWPTEPNLEVVLYQEFCGYI